MKGDGQAQSPMAVEQTSVSEQKETENRKISPPKDAKQRPNLASVYETLSFARTQQTKLQTAGAFFFAVVSGSTFPAMIFYFAEIFEDISRSTEDEDFMETIRSMVYAFLILGVVILISMTLQNLLMESAAETMTHHLQNDWFRALLRQDMAYYDIKDVAGEASILSSNAKRYHLGVGRKLAESVQYFVSFAGSLGYAFYSSWKVSLAVLSICPFLVCSVYFLLKMNQTQTAHANATYAKAGSIVQTAISAIRTILSLNAVENVVDQYKEATQEACDGAVGQVWLVGLAYGSQFASFMLSYVVVTLFGTWLLYDNVEESGCDPSGTVFGNERCDPAGVEVYGALLGVSFGAAVLPQIAVSIEKFIGAREACFPALKVIRRSKEPQTDVDDTIDSLAHFRRGDSALPPYVIDSSSTSGGKPAVVMGDILFSNVQFSYPTRRETKFIEDFSLHIPAGKTVALVGVSGSGKSSVVQLLERFYDPDSGSIKLDGEDLRNLSIPWLRENIGLVSQEPKLFAMSIRDNIAAGLPNATEQEIIEAAKTANAHDFISSFPNGYDTDVGDLGGQLSGGQKQRIAISRALLKQPKILVMDESTSSLDSESEKTVQSALDAIMRSQGITSLVIAHILSTIRAADMIAVLAEGRVAETGTHAELLAERGYYFNMVEAQSAPTDSRESKESTFPPASVGPAIEANTTKDSDEAVIQFHDVHFAFPSRPNTPIFKGLNLSVRRGETLAIVGPSGQGKSTIIQLIENFYRPSEGRITFNGRDMADLDVRWLRDQFGLVGQEPALFDTSIKENIRFGLPNASHEQVVEAAKQANAHTFISEFPEGYNTKVGQGSSLISGGQKQRIAIARAILKRPGVLLLDEATSCLDSKSEKVVQEALDTVLFGTDQTCVVVAHRLSTIRNASRIAVIDGGGVCEIGTHDELMAKPEGRYKDLQVLQDLKNATSLSGGRKGKGGDGKDTDKKRSQAEDTVAVTGRKGDGDSIGKEKGKELALKASLFGKEDRLYFFVGGVGAVLTGLMFPSWGFMFAYMTDILFYPVLPCPGPEFGISDDCDEYWASSKDFMKDRSFDIFYGFLGVIVSSLIGYVLLYTGFGFASERMNKRTRDAAFSSLLRQEVGWFDVRSAGNLCSRLADDAALLRAFSGEPIRTLMMNLASVFVGFVVSFIYMWPFALLTLGLLPFMAFGAEMEMRTYLGEDEGDADQMEDHSPGSIVMDTLREIRTVVSLTLEKQRAEEYADALEKVDRHPIRTKIVKGSGSGLGQFTQMWGFGLMFFWGGWLLQEFPSDFTFREYLIAMFSFMFSLYGLAAAFEGTADREQAKAAAARIFEIIDRKSLIDPLATTGRVDV